MKKEAQKDAGAAETGEDLSRNLTQGAVHLLQPLNQFFDNVICDFRPSLGANRSEKAAVEPDGQRTRFSDDVNAPQSTGEKRHFAKKIPGAPSGQGAWHPIPPSRARVSRGVHEGLGPRHLQR